MYVYAVRHDVTLLYVHETLSERVNVMMCSSMYVVELYIMTDVMRMYNDGHLYVLCCMCECLDVRTVLRMYVTVDVMSMYERRDDLR